MKNRIAKYGITIRIIVLFVALVIVPYMIFSAVVFYGFQNYTIKNLSITTNDTMSIVQSQVDSELERYEEMTMTLYHGGYIERLTEEGAREEITNLLSGICFSDTHIHAAYLVTENQTFSSGAPYEELFEVMKEYEPEIHAAGGRCIWYSTNALRGNARQNRHVLARQLNDKQGKSVGILYFILDEKIVTEAFSQLTSDYSVKYLTDSRGRVLYTSGDQSIGTAIDVTGIAKTRRSGYQAVKWDSGKNILVYSKMKNADWYCISVIPFSEVRRDIRQMALPFVILSAVYVMFLLLMLYVLRKYIFSPLSSLKKVMDDYAQGGLEQVQIGEIGTCEFRSLSRHFNQMTERISNLMTAYKQETDEKNRQRMQALSAQLTPHFIYNALNTIKWLAVLNKQKNIQNLTESLIYIFKNAVRVDDENYTVGDEVKLITHYAVIQKARFMNFELQVEVDEACLGYRLRKLLVQPIVENAIVHGLRRDKEMNGEILLRIWEEDGELSILVKDNGAGFDVEQWRSHPVQKEGHTNIGLHNVEEIIRLEYGEGYYLEIESTPGAGTAVRYHLPVEKKDSMVGGSQNDTNNYSG